MSSQSILSLKGLNAGASPPAVMIHDRTFHGKMQIVMRHSGCDTPGEHRLSDWFQGNCCKWL